MAQIFQADPYVHCFWMVLADGKTPAPEKIVTVQISKAGEAFTDPSGGPDAHEIGFGWYSIQLLPADTAVLGDLCYHYEAEGCGCSDMKDQVVPRPNLIGIDADLQQTNALLARLADELAPIN